jgi:hypothetical protein
MTATTSKARRSKLTRQLASSRGRDDGVGCLVLTLIASEDAVVCTIQHVPSTVRSSSVGSGPGALIVKDGYV